MTPAEVDELSPEVYDAFVRHMKTEARELVKMARRRPRR